MSLQDGGEYSSEEPEEYSVEAIIGWRYSQEHRCKEFRVKWVGYPLDESTWEPESNLNCPDLIDIFERSLDDTDSKCYEADNLDNLNGFERHANLRDILSLQLLDNEHYFLCQFDDCQNLEQIRFDQVFKYSPIKALQFLGERNIKSDSLDVSH